MVIGTLGDRSDAREARGCVSYFGSLLVCIVSMTFSLGARGDVYLVLVEGEPVVSYRGSVPGFVATDGFSHRSSSFSMAGCEPRPRSWSCFCNVVIYTFFSNVFSDLLLVNISLLVSGIDCAC